MGTWGHGNFENDTVAEYYCELLKPLLSQIRNTVSDVKLMEPDEPDSEVMLANIEILTVLAENIGRTEKEWVGDLVFPFPFPDPSEIKTWKTEYLKVWDDQIDGLEPTPEHKQKRRGTIENTFDRFIKISKDGPRTDA